MVTTVKHAFAYGVDDFKWLNHSACWQIFDFQAATGHFIDTGDVLLRHLAENFVRTPGALHLENDGRLGDGNHGRAHQRHCNSSSGSFAKEAATAGNGAFAVG